MTLLDKALLKISPERAVSRELAKIKYKALKSVSNGFSASVTPSQTSETRWRGASRALRSMLSWLPGLGSARSDLPATERRILIARSNDAYRNHMLAGAAIARCRTNIIGTGLIPHPNIDAEALGITKEEAEKLNNDIAHKWKLWAENPRECDSEATQDFYGLQALSLVSSMLNGDVFALTPFVAREGGLFGLKVQLIDAPRISNPNDQTNQSNLVDGIELDDLGQPIRYWINRRHPGDNTIIQNSVIFGWDSVEVFGTNTGRRRALHIWNDKDRVGAVRGAPYLSPILEPLQTLEQYGRAELAAAVVSAMFTVFIERESLIDDGAGTPAIGVPDSNGSLALGNAAIVDLSPGEKANFANPSRPNANYDPFFLSIVKQIGARLEIPVDELLLHYQSSYSAARAAMLQAWRFYTMRRWWIVQQFCQPIYALWFDELVARGLINVDNYADPMRRAAYNQAIWVGPARGSMDELKEAQAAKARIDAGVSNEAIETASMSGEDWGSVYAQRLREIKRRKADGVWVDNNPQPAPISIDPNQGIDPSNTNGS